jgi:hypothetical protein
VNGEPTIREREIALAALEEWSAAFKIIANDLAENRAPPPEHLERAQQAMLCLENARVVLSLIASIGIGS